MTISISKEETPEGTKFTMSQDKVDTQKYLEFVDAVTSNESKNYYDFAQRIAILQDQDFPTERLLTAAVGMSAEAGEFTEIIKKIIFQGKPVNEENLFHLKRELGDIMWYVAQACIGLDISLDEVMEMNVEKLVARYPGGEFDVHYSENRKDGDL
ncbi:MazG-like pyrophosphatase [Synechococcus phage S-SCSM1]|uniref:Pyrophosphohydrolase n=1 Tax=Synechococcus phage S-SCSM1 TaxID=2588487 RepID=A0A6M2ZHF6_9CAUD|nr:MazG-like pyrophosphatase [Synechococcus phage S-SCSM1]QFG06340.1 pyrophosphohydrolase [Synechococcus phage S-SCSM1]